MSTNDPMTQKKLDAIRARADIIRAGVNAMTVNDSRCSYPWPDPTNERIKELEKENAELRKRLTVDEDMVERAARAFYEYPTPGVDVSLTPGWDRLTASSPDIAAAYRNRIRAALEAAHNPGMWS